MDTPQTEKSVKGGQLNLAPVIGKTVRIHKLALWVGNALFLLPLLLRKYTIQGLAVYIGCLLLLLWREWKSSSNFPAAAELPAFLLADSTVLAGLYFEELKALWDLSAADTFFRGSGNWFWILLVVGMLVGAAGLFSEEKAWISGIGGALVGTALILQGWSNGRVEEFAFVPGGRALLHTFLLAAFLWTVCLYAIVRTAPKKRGGALGTGFLLLCAFTVLLIAEKGFLNAHMPTLERIWQQMPTRYFAWWKTLLGVALLAGLAVTLYVREGDKGNHLSVDTYALILGAELLLCVRLLWAWYVPFGWLLLVFLAIGVCRCMENDYAGKKTFRLDSVLFLPTQFVCGAAALFLLRQGLWINVLVTAVLAAFFYAQWGKKKTASTQARWWVVLLCGIAGEMAAMLFHYRFSREGLALLVSILIVSVLAVLTLSTRQPAGRTVPVWTRAVVCGCAVVLCLALFSQGGVAISLEETEDGASVIVELTPRGSENRLSSAEYLWRDKWGRTRSRERTPVQSGEIIPVEGEVLTILARDAQGVETSRVMWFPARDT